MATEQEKEHEGVIGDIAGHLWIQEYQWERVKNGFPDSTVRLLENYPLCESDKIIAADIARLWSAMRRLNARLVRQLVFTADYNAPPRRVLSSDDYLREFAGIYPFMPVGLRGQLLRLISFMWQNICARNEKMIRKFHLSFSLIPLDVDFRERDYINDGVLVRKKLRLQRRQLMNRQCSF